MTELAKANANRLTECVIAASPFPAQEAGRRSPEINEWARARMSRKITPKSIAHKVFARLDSTLSAVMQPRGRAARTWSYSRIAACVLLVGAGAQVSPALSGTLDATPVRFMPYGQMVPAPRGAANLCTTYTWACMHSGRNAQITQQQLNDSIRINQRINRTVRQIPDVKQYGREGVWSLPTARGGDCEDIALQKKLELIKAGLPPERLLLATVLDKNRQAHAVLVLKTGRGHYVLDNLTNEVKLWEQTNYTFLRIQNPDAPSSWVSVFAGGMLS